MLSGPCGLSLPPGTGSTSCPLWKLLEIRLLHRLDPWLQRLDCAAFLISTASYPTLDSMLGTTDALSLLFIQATLRNAYSHSPHLTAGNTGPERVTYQLKLHCTQALVPRGVGLDLRKHLEALGSGHQLCWYSHQPCAMSGPVGTDSSRPLPSTGKTA